MERLTHVQELRILRAGARAYRTGRPSTACPHLIPSVRGDVWLAGWVTARLTAEGPQPLH